MIRANELMIGNYVSRPDLGNGEQRTEQVLAIFERVKTTGPIKTIVDFSDIKPIPLTEEWLIKFGFEKKTHSFVIKSISIKLQSKFYFYAPTSIMIKHVHQLQNLCFALGEQLTIKETDENGKELTHWGGKK